MKEWVARAMQVATLEKDQLETIQRIERDNGFLMANWNIQDLLKLPSLKETFGIPDDSEAQAIHSLRIEKDIKAKGLLNTPEDVQGMDFFHSVDWNILHNKENIVWDYAGRREGKKLLEKLMGACLIIATYGR